MFGGLNLNPVNLMTTAALGVATGGTSLLVTQIVSQIASKIGQQMIQQFGQQMGLPQGAIDMAQGAFAGSVGDTGGAIQNYQEAGSSYAQQFFPGATPQQQGDIDRGSDTIARSMADWMAANAPGGSDENGNPRGLSAGRGGGSWLMALARALGNQLNAAQAKLERTMDGTNWEKSDQVAEFQAMSQEFALFMNTATNVLKTVGESLSTMARKQ